MTSLFPKTKALRILVEAVFYIIARHGIGYIVGS